MKPIEEYDIDDLKQVYRVLHGQLQENPDLMDSDVLQDLQTLLQASAKTDGVDVSNHALWAAWLNGGVILRSV